MADTLILRHALQLAIDWHNNTHQDFVATWGHGMSGREMVAILREVAMEHDGSKFPCEAGAPDCGDATYYGWDKQWYCSNHAPSDRHDEHRLAFPVFERTSRAPNG